MAELPATMLALTINENKVKVTRRPLPALRPSYLLCQVDSIALNPTDWKHIAGRRANANCIAGCDFAGLVVSVGDEVVTKHFQPGDRVMCTTHGANWSQPEDGCFAEFAVCKGDLAMRVPTGMSMEEACTFPLGCATVAQGLYQKGLKLRLPDNNYQAGTDFVLIYGGSTATGSLGVQFAKLSGYRVIATAGRHNHAFVKSLGAEEVFDYKDADCARQIKEYTGDSLKLVWDTVSLESSAQICSDAIATDPSGARYGHILPVNLPRKNEVTTVGTLMYTIFGEEYVKNGKTSPASREDFDFAKMFFGITEKLIADGKLKSHPEQVGTGGLEGALRGMQEMKAEKHSGVKMVYRVKETEQQAGLEIEL